jgi:hypothetical protein
MSGADVAFAALAANPVGGLLVAIPFAILQLHYPIWRAVLTGVPLAYLQVIAVDAAWGLLNRLSWWRRLLQTRRGGWVRSLMDSRGGFWVTFVASPIVGPWLVMALMRYTQVPQRRVALPIVLSMAAFATGLSVACAVTPQLFAK